MDNTNKFTGKAVSYQKYRPEYPNECISFILKRSKVTKDSVIADIGAGTGKLTKLFLDKGFKVIAVEPNSDMINTLKDTLRNYENLVEVNLSSAENTKIASNSTDLITVAQAFHWFEPDLFKAECKRILKSNGYVAILANLLNLSFDMEIKIKEIHEKYTDYCFDKFKNSSITDFFNNSFFLKDFENNILLNEEEFVGLFNTMSYSLKETDKMYDEYITEFKKLFNEYSNNGFITLHHITKCCIGRLK